MARKENLWSDSKESTRPAHDFLQPCLSETNRAGFFWSAAATVVCAVLLAQWTWVFTAPKDAALPTTAAWKKTSAADHFFGDAQATGAGAVGSPGNMQLVGVFAHPTAGFAVLSVEGKQVGTGLGELVMPGARLVETKADYVLIERGGVNSRIDLPAGKPVSGIIKADSKEINIAATPGSAPHDSHLSPGQRAAMQQELEHFRRKP